MRIHTLNATVSSGSLNHSILAGLGGDDHTQYLLVDGTRSITGNLTVDGNLNVNGTTTTIDTTQMAIEDNLIILNRGEAGAGVTEGFAGIAIDRGSETDAHISWNESTDLFQVGISGALINIIGADGSVPFTGNVGGITPTSAAHLTRKDYVDGQDTTISGDLQTNINTNTTAIALNTTHRSSDGSDHADVVTNTAGVASNLALISTVSGALSSEIDSDISTHESGSSHDGRYYTESELDAGQLDNRYHTEAEITTISGDLVAQLHTQSHAITSTSDHSASNWSVTYSDGSGEVIEVPLGVSGTVLTSQGVGIAPIFV